MTLNHRTMHELTLRVLSWLTCQEYCCSHVLYHAVRLSLNGTIFNATFHNNMIVVVAILTTLRPCQICRHIPITILHHYKQRHILSCILLCSLEIASTHYHIVSRLSHKATCDSHAHTLSSRVMLWLTCTSILQEYIVTNMDVHTTQNLEQSSYYSRQSQSLPDSSSLVSLK
jgi:hypothetical protein